MDCPPDTLLAGISGTRAFVRTHAHMISFSIYMQTPDGTLDTLLTGLNIRTENAVAHDDPHTDFSFFERSENALLFTKVDGAFQFACDVTLFDTGPGALHDLLRACSMRDIQIALPDEDTDDPFACWLFSRGGKEAVSIHTNELTDSLKMERRGPVS